jgi:hypothetical protein
MIRTSTAGLLASVLVAAGALAVLTCCGSDPAATELPADEGRIRVVGATPGGDAPLPPARPAPVSVPPLATAPAPGSAAASPTPAGAAAPASAPAPREGLFAALEVNGVKGGELGFVVPGTVAEVEAALLDFDAATGHRAWAQRYRVVSRSGSQVVAEWRFKGRMGVNPTVHLEFTPEPDGVGRRIRYRVVQKAFGIASFFGDYRLEPLAGEPPRVLVTERVFIDSGLSFNNASHEDVEKGLREDARLFRAWMEERTGRSD